MKSKLSHYPYARPQYEWEKKHLEETFGEYYSKYKADEITEEGHYGIRKATEEEKSQTNKIVMPTKLFTYSVDTNYQWPTKQMPNLYKGYYEDNTITDIEGRSAYSHLLYYTIPDFKREYVYLDENWACYDISLKDKILKELSSWEHRHEQYGKLTKYSINEVAFVDYNRGGYGKDYGRSHIAINAHYEDGKIYQVYTFSLKDINIPEDYSSGDYYEFKAKDGFGLINNTLYGLEEITRYANNETQNTGYYYLRRNRDYTLREFATKEEVSVHNLKVLRFADEDERIDPENFFERVKTEDLLVYLVNNKIQFYKKNDTTAYVIDYDISYITYHYWFNLPGYEKLQTIKGYVASDGYNTYFIRDGLAYRDKAINDLNDYWDRNYMEDAENGTLLTEYNVSYEQYQIYSYAPIIEWNLASTNLYNNTLSNYKGRYTVNKLYDNLYYFKFLDGSILKPSLPSYNITELICEYKDGRYYYNGITTFDITKKGDPDDWYYPLLQPFSFVSPDTWAGTTITHCLLNAERPRSTYTFDGMLWIPKNGHYTYYIHQTKYEIPGIPGAIDEPLIVPNELVDKFEEQGIILSEGTADYIVDTSKIYYHYDDITKNVFDKESDYIDLDNITLFKDYVPESRTYWLHEHNKEYDCVLPDNPGSIIKDNYYYEHHIEPTDYKYIVYDGDELVLSETPQNEISIIPYKPRGEIYYLNGKKYNKTTEYLCDLLDIYKAEIGGCDKRTYYSVKDGKKFTNNHIWEPVSRILPDGSYGPFIFVNTNGVGFIECITEQKDNWVEVNTGGDALNTNGFVIKDNAFYINCDNELSSSYAVWEKYRGDTKGQSVFVDFATDSETPKVYQDDLTTEIPTISRHTGWLKIGWIEDNKFYTYGYNQTSARGNIYGYDLVIVLKNYGLYYTELETVADNGKVSPREFNYQVGKYLELDSEYVYNEDSNYLPHEDIYDYDNLTLTIYKDLAITIKNQLELGEKELLNNISYTKTVNDGDSIDFTTIASASITAQLNYPVEEANKLVGQNFTYLLDYGDGEWHNMGLFTIDEAESIDAYTSRITGHDHMYRLNKYVDDFIANYTYPTTLKKLWYDLLDYCDIFHDKEEISGVNADLVLNRNFEAVKTSALQLAEYITQLMAGYAHINKDNFSATISHYESVPASVMPSNYTDISHSPYNSQVPNQIKLGYNNDKTVSTSEPINRYYEEDIPCAVIDNTEYKEVVEYHYDFKVKEYTHRVDGKPLEEINEEIDTGKYFIYINNGNAKAQEYGYRKDTEFVPYYITDNALITYNIDEDECKKIMANICGVLKELPLDYRKCDLTMLTPTENYEIKIGDIIEATNKLGKKFKMMVMEISIDGSGITYKSFGEAQYPVQGESINSQIIFLEDLQGQISEIRGDGQETKKELVEITAAQTELVDAVNDLYEETIGLGANLVAFDEKYQNITNQIIAEHDEDIVEVYAAIDAKAEEVKGYADGRDAETLRDAKKYADEQDAINLQAAKDYADSIKTLIPSGTTLYIDTKDTGVCYEMWIGDADKHNGVKFEYWYKSNPVYVNRIMYFNNVRFPITEQIGG